MWGALAEAVNVSHEKGPAWRNIQLGESRRQNLLIWVSSNPLLPCIKGMPSTVTLMQGLRRWANSFVANYRAYVSLIG